MSLELLIMPTVGYIKEDMGIPEIDDEHDDAALYQQGYDIEEVEIEDQEQFTIPLNHIGRINGMILPLLFPNKNEDSELVETLPAGSYIYDEGRQAIIVLRIDDNSIL